MDVLRPFKEIIQYAYTFYRHGREGEGVYLSVWFRDLGEAERYERQSGGCRLETSPSPNPIWRVDTEAFDRHRSRLMKP